jgi:predicted LPLAT superfamily acyltransferase
MPDTITTRAEALEAIADAYAAALEHHYTHPDEDPN